jgi:hypothetical protein
MMQGVSVSKTNNNKLVQIIIYTLILKASIQFGHDEIRRGLDVYHAGSDYEESPGPSYPLLSSGMAPLP